MRMHTAATKCSSLPMIRRLKPAKKRRRVEDSSDDDIAEYACAQ